jgi:hypothetical protein
MLTTPKINARIREGNSTNLQFSALDSHACAQIDHAMGCGEFSFRKEQVRALLKVQFIFESMYSKQITKVLYTRLYRL